MFGNSTPSKPTAPPYQPAAPYQSAPAFNPINFGPGSIYDVPVQGADQLTSSALGISNTGSAAGNLSAYAPWTNLQNNPTDQANVAQAENYYNQTQVNPQLAANASALNANGQGGSSYAGAYLGQEQAMGNLNAFEAGLSQQEQDYQNQLSAINSLYSGPIGLAQQQNQLGVNQGLALGALADSQNIAQNSYNLANTQGQNNYNLGVNQIANNYSQGIYGARSGQYNAQLGAQAQRFGSGIAQGGLAGGMIGALI